MSAPPPLPLFLYGTLRDPEIFAAVLGRPIGPGALRCAEAPGWRAVYYPGEVFPALVPAARDAAPGLLADGLTKDDLARLDAYEGNRYARKTLSTLSGADVVAAQAYLPGAPIGENAPAWTFEDWVTMHRPDVIEEETRFARKLAGN